MSFLIRISRDDPGTPWGFRLRGGQDFGEPLHISAVTPGGLAETCGLRPGMRVLSIGRDLTNHMTHQQAHQAIIRCCNDLEIEVYDTGLINKSGYVTPTHHMNIRSSPMSTDLYKPVELQTTKAVIHIGTNPRISPCHSPNRINITVSDSNSTTIYDRVSTEKINITCTSPVYRSPDVVSIKPSFSSLYSLSTYSTPNSAVANMQSNSKPNHRLNQSPPLLRKGILRSKDLKLCPVCRVCQQQIHGPFIDTNDHCYCPNHFVCAHCHAPLNAECFFAEQNGKLYCERDFKEHIACRCGKCHQPIIGKIIKAMNQTWHPNCFTCYHCKKPLDNIFHVEDMDRVLCEEHWKKLHEGECAKCKQPISEIDRFIEACGKQYHARCFSCAACQTPLEGKPFHARDEKPFCLVHAHAVALFG
ncbi:unnamed protein product [Trichobilharzia szidati]|nr:unnamed protein product [Trichobilharzia szidati]